MSKRMFSPSIVESDVFLDMPLSGQSLYFHLNMNADWDGFVNPKRVMRMIGAANDDLQILIAKRFLIVFDSGVVAIKHWWINNTRRMDRMMPTNYQTELAELGVKPNKAYTRITTQIQFDTEVGIIPATMWQPNGNDPVPKRKEKKLKETKLNQTTLHEPKPAARGINKKTYAAAVRHDEELTERANDAKTRKGSMKSLSEMYKERKATK